MDNKDKELEINQLRNENNKLSLENIELRNYINEFEKIQSLLKKRRNNNKKIIHNLHRNMVHYVFLLLY
jgi:regulator of replication initiation timing